MNAHSQKANDKIDTLYKFIFKTDPIEKVQSEIENTLPKFNDRTLYTVFFSVCDKLERAKIFRYSSPSLETAWKKAAELAVKFAGRKYYNCSWIKADIMKNAVERPFGDVLKDIKHSRNEFYRKGLSFDSEYKTALLEAEMNGNRIISYKKKDLELSCVNKYTSVNCGKSFVKMPDTLIEFDCMSFFCDEDDTVYKLFSSGNNCGRRIISHVGKKEALDVIETSSEYLSFQVGLDGKFDYGYYPVYHKLIPGYNVLRHSSSIWSLICAYDLTKDKLTLSKINSAVGFMIENTVRRPDSADTSFLAERSAGEIKLGGNAVAVILLTEYMKRIGTDEPDKFTKVCTALGNGILELLDSETGEFYHVLRYPGFYKKDKYRTVYYDGEAAFALCRLYSLTKDEKWLNAARTAVDRFIRCDYTKHRDHWVAYALNEITMYLPEEKYFEFALKNANVNLKRIYDQDTTYHTYLELLTVTFETYMRIIDGGYKVDYLEEFDLEFFIKTIFHRAHYMLNGYGYPEYVMYLKYPEKILGSFFVRHDGYRIRIDDIQHFCGAYYSYYRHYDELDEIRKRLDIDIDESH